MLKRFNPGMTLQLAAAYFILIAYAVLALFPVVLVVMNSVKKRQSIFRETYDLSFKPLGINTEMWDPVGYSTVAERGNFPDYFFNSTVVTVGSIFLILLAGSMAAFALSEYKFRGNTVVGLYLSLGIMIPIRLGSVSLIKMMVKMGLTNTLVGLILVYTAAGLPLAIFILSSFMQTVPKDLKDAARVDGASEYWIYWMVLPLVRPALGTVAVFNMIPVWNDLWFPLILAPAESSKTVTLGAQVFLGQFANDWNAILASLTLSMVPIIFLYIIFSRQLIRGLTAGSVK